VNDGSRTEDDDDANASSNGECEWDAGDILFQSFLDRANVDEREGRWRRLRRRARVARARGRPVARERRRGARAPGRSGDAQSARTTHARGGDGNDIAHGRHARRCEKKRISNGIS